MTARLVAVVATCCALGCTEDATPPPEPIQPMSGSMMPHGDHSPRYGGTVWMHGDLHFEVVLSESGEHSIYYSDAARVELPAAVASDVKIVVARPDEAPEELELEIDEFGESWFARGRSIDDPNARAVVSFSYESEPYEIDLPFLAEPVDPSAPDPHAVP